MCQQLEARGMEAVRIQGRDGTDPLVFDSADRSVICPLSKGAVGCFESHIHIWKTIVAEKHPAAIVLEDDVILAQDFPRVSKIASEKCEFDVIKLDFHSPRIRAGIQGIPVVYGRQLHRYLGLDWCTGGYIVSNVGAKKLLRASRSYYRAVDYVMYNEKSRFLAKSKIYSLVPAICIQLNNAIMPQLVESEFNSNINGSERPMGKALPKIFHRFYYWWRWDSNSIRKYEYRSLIYRLGRKEDIGELSNFFWDSVSDAREHPALFSGLSGDGEL